MTARETVPDTWDRDRDERFFSITARLFPSVVCAAASVLLGGDDEPAPRRGGPVDAGRRIPPQAPGSHDRT